MTGTTFQTGRRTLYVPPANGPNDTAYRWKRWGLLFWSTPSPFGSSTEKAGWLGRVTVRKSVNDIEGLRIPCGSWNNKGDSQRCPTMPWISHLWPGALLRRPYLDAMPTALSLWAPELGDPIHAALCAKVPGVSPKPHNLTLCGGCSHVFQSDLHVSMVYDGSYAHQYDHRPHEEMSQLRWDFIQEHLTLDKGSKVLDVGYGNGAFLKHARRAGMEIFGIDLHGEDFGIPEVSYDSPIGYDLVCFSLDRAFPGNR